MPGPVDSGGSWGGGGQVRGPGRGLHKVGKRVGQRGQGTTCCGLRTLAPIKGSEHGGWLWPTM